MIDLIDRQKAIEAIKKCVQDMRKYPLPDVLKKTVAENILKDVPSVDAVPVVRCKDCKYMTEYYDTTGNAPYWTCSQWDSAIDYDGFCYYAERRSDDDPSHPFADDVMMGERKDDGV